MPRIDSFTPSVQPQLRPQPLTPATTQSQVQEVTPARDQVVLTGLTDEETKFIELKLLPTNYPELKACLKEKGMDAAKALARQGKKGPFTASYGDPNKMFATAKRISSNPELTRLFQDIKKGDILLHNWNSSNIVSELTKGPYNHAIICTSDGPPPDFIEAYGLDGTSQEEGGNCVRRVPLSGTINDGLSVRIVRPADALAEPQRSQAINDAVAYAEQQLGRPYDYAMTNVNEGDGLANAFYCSELAYKAYAEGSKIKFPLGKSPERDKIVVAVNSLVNALAPKNKAELVNKVWTFMNHSPAPNSDEFIGFMVEKVLPACRSTEGICASGASQDSLKSTIKSVLEGRVFMGFSKAVQDYETQEKAGAFKGFWGTLKQMKAKLDTTTAFAGDFISLVRASGINVTEGLFATKRLMEAFLPHSETLATYFWGSNNANTKAVSSLMDRLDALKADNIPLISGMIPGRVQNPIQYDFVSPTDLAMTPLPHLDYNVK